MNTKLVVKFIRVNPIYRTGLSRQRTIQIASLLKNILFFLLFFSLADLLAQDTLFYNNAWLQLPSLENSEYYTIVFHHPVDKNKATEKTYVKSGLLIEQTNYADYIKYKRVDTVRQWYNDGKLMTEANYSDGKLHGKVQTYWKNSQLKRDDQYENGKLLKGKSYRPDGTEMEHDEYETLPQFPGGENALRSYMTSNIKYPAAAREARLSGTVVIKFMVRDDGLIINITVAKGVSKELNEEAIRLVTQMPRWQAGVLDGTKKVMSVSLPVTYKFM